MCAKFVSNRVFSISPYKLVFGFAEKLYVNTNVQCVIQLLRR